MKKLYTLGVLSLAILALVTFAPPASAAVVGHLSVGICGPSGGEAGGVLVSAGAINWSPGSPAACLQTGSGTAITSAAGLLTELFVGIGTINDLAIPAGLDPLIAGFMTFSGDTLTSPLMFNLAAVGGFGPGSGVPCSPDPAVNDSCSVPGSPFLLTRTLTGTSVSLLAHGTILDTDGITSNWNGAFTTQLNSIVGVTGIITPEVIQGIIAGGGSIRSSFSGEFDVSAVPEPVSMALIGGGLIALAAFKKRKRA